MKTFIGLFALAAGIAAAFYVISQRDEQAPAWPNKKKLRKEARRAEAAARRAAAPARAAKVHVEREANTDLKVPLGDLTR